MEENRQEIVEETLSPSLRLTVTQEKAARLLAEGYTQTETARRVGVTKQTMNRWAKDPHMKRRVNELRLDVVKQADDTLTMSIPDAAATVAQVASGRAAFEDVKELTPRLRAAFYILDRVFKQKMPKANPKGDEEHDLSSDMDDSDINDIISKAFGK